jgi:hypothetical protein
LIYLNNLQLLYMVSIAKLHNKYAYSSQKNKFFFQNYNLYYKLKGGIILCKIYCLKNKLINYINNESFLLYKSKILIKLFNINENLV